MKIKILPTLIFILSTFLTLKVVKVYNHSTHNVKNNLKNVIINELDANKAIALEKEEIENNSSSIKESNNSGDGNEVFYKERPKDIVSFDSDCLDVDRDILLTLKKRREELDKWVQEAKIKENVLKTAEAKINNKISELKAIKSEVTLLLEEYNKKEDEKLISLVKIYESMNPKFAAQIFEQLDMQILLDVIDKMKEAKVAQILARVNPIRAKEITKKFAERRRLPENN